MCENGELEYNESYGVWVCKKCGVTYCKNCTKDPYEHNTIGPDPKHPITSIKKEREGYPKLKLEDLSKTIGVCLKCNEYYLHQTEKDMSSIMWIGIGEGGSNVVQTCMRYMRDNKDVELAAALMWNATNNRYLAINCGPEIRYLDVRFFPKKRSKTGVQLRSNYHTLWLSRDDNLKGCGHHMGKGRNIMDQFKDDLNQKIRDLCRIKERTKIAQDNNQQLPRLPRFIIIINSTGGGTGSGATPIAIETIRGMDPDAIIINFNIMPYWNDAKWYGNTVYCFARAIQLGYQSYSQRNWDDKTTFINYNPSLVKIELKEKIKKTLKSVHSEWWDLFVKEWKTEKFIYAVLDDNDFRENNIAGQLISTEFNGTEEEKLDQINKLDDKLDDMVKELLFLTHLGKAPCHSCPEWNEISSIHKASVLSQAENYIMAKIAGNTSASLTLEANTGCKGSSCPLNNPTIEKMKNLFKYSAWDQKLKFIYISNQFFMGQMGEVERKYKEWLQQTDRMEEFEAEVIALQQDQNINRRVDEGEVLRYRATNQIVARIIGNILTPLLLASTDNVHKDRIEQTIINKIKNDDDIKEFILNFDDREKMEAWINNLPEPANLNQQTDDNPEAQVRRRFWDRLVGDQSTPAPADTRDQDSTHQTRGIQRDKISDQEDFCKHTDPISVAMILDRIPIQTLQQRLDKSDINVTSSDLFFNNLGSTWYEPTLDAETVGDYFWITASGPTAGIYPNKYAKSDPEFSSPNMEVLMGEDEEFEEEEEDRDDDFGYDVPSANRHYTQILYRGDPEIENLQDIGTRLKKDFDRICVEHRQPYSYCKAFTSPVNYNNISVSLLSGPLFIEMLQSIAVFDLYLAHEYLESNKEYTVPGEIYISARESINNAAPGLWDHTDIEPVLTATKWIKVCPASQWLTTKNRNNLRIVNNRKLLDQINFQRVGVNQLVQNFLRPPQPQGGQGQGQHPPPQDPGGGGIPPGNEEEQQQAVDQAHQNENAE